MFTTPWLSRAAALLLLAAVLAAAYVWIVGPSDLMRAELQVRLLQHLNSRPAPTGGAFSYRRAALAD